jgi:uncharacterized membrane protein
MTHAAIGLVLLSAFLHAAWNVLNKGSGDRWGFFIAQGGSMLTAYAPGMLWLWPGRGLEPMGWACIVGSGVVHAAYAAYLLKSYDAGDLSVAYPLSRSAPVLVLGWDLLAARASLTVWGMIGAALAGLGALTLQLPAVRARGLRAVLADPVTRYALLTAVTIAVYTLIDKRGVASVQPFVFLYAISVVEFILLGMLIGRGAASRARAAFRANAAAVLFTGVIGPLSYLLILWVLVTAPASYVLGLRQTSIVFGVVLGRLLLGEGETIYRLAGALIIAAGSTLIAVAG